MLIKCPECNKEVSDLSKICVHCGYPLEDWLNGTLSTDSGNKLYCIINGTKKDVTYFVNKILDGSWDDDILKFNLRLMEELDVAMLGFVEAVEECGGAPKEYNATSIKELRCRQRAIQASKIHCPNCRSTDVKRISATERAASVIGFGLLSKKINKTYKCNKCKYTW